MDVFKAYAAGTTVYCLIQSAALFLCPSLLLTLMTPTLHDATHLELYLCTALSLSLATLGLVTFLLSGVMPVTSSLAGRREVQKQEREGRRTGSPYHVPTLWITFLYHVASGFTTYSTARHIKSGPDGGPGGAVRIYYLACTISCGLALMGGWCGLFATENGEISRASVLDNVDADRSGADHGTGEAKVSGWPFKNTHRDAKKKT